MTNQNFNNLLTYIKRRLGAHVNFIEMDDNDIIDYIKEHTLVEFSHFDPRYKSAIIDENHRRIYDFDENVYVIPISEDEHILEIYEIQEGSPDQLLRSYHEDGIFSSYGGSIIDYTLASVENSMHQSLKSVLTFELIQGCEETDYKSMIKFSRPIRKGCLLKVGLTHKELSTLSSDVYSYFKDFCLRDIVELLIADRSKFEELSTNTANIRLNLQFLEQLKGDLEQKLERRRFLVDKYPLVWL